MKNKLQLGLLINLLMINLNLQSKVEKQQDMPQVNLPKKAGFQKTLRRQFDRFNRLGNGVKAGVGLGAVCVVGGVAKAVSKARQKKSESTITAYLSNQQGQFIPVSKIFSVDFFAQKVTPNILCLVVNNKSYKCINENYSDSIYTFNVDNQKVVLKLSSDNNGKSYRLKVLQQDQEIDFLIDNKNVQIFTGENLPEGVDLKSVVCPDNPEARHDAQNQNADRTNEDKFDELEPQVDGSPNVKPVVAEEVKRPEVNPQAETPVKRAESKVPVDKGEVVPQADVKTEQFSGVVTAIADLHEGNHEISVNVAADGDDEDIKNITITQEQFKALKNGADDLKVGDKVALTLSGDEASELKRVAAEE